MRAGRLHFRNFTFYVGAVVHRVLPRLLLRARLWGLLEPVNSEKRGELLERIDYCNKLNAPFEVPLGTPRCRFKKVNSIYYFDFQRMVRHFPARMRYFHRFGDERRVPEQPTFVKSRPIAEPNANSVILKLDSVRHFRMANDAIPYLSKKPLAVFRGACHQPHRREFLALTAGVAGTDIGDTRAAAEPEFRRSYLSVPQQLEYRFILSVEGNDVATNLKWILSSNSLCFMRQPRFETWFMEGRLEPGRHFVLLREDYSDLAEKIAFYNDHPDLALEIIKNAQAHVRQFTGSKIEKAASLLVLAKYFALSGQLDPRIAEDFRLPWGGRA